MGCGYPSDEENNELHIEIELPGVKKEDINWLVKRVSMSGMLEPVSPWFMLGVFIGIGL